MVKDQEVYKILNQLNNQTIVEFALAGSEVMVRAIDQSTKLSFSTTIYQGSSYIPTSVRSSLSKALPKGSIPTYINVDEEDYRITLHYLGRLEGMHPAQLKVLLEEFAVIAEDWRQVLDDMDNNDRVYIYNKR
ncbi:MAG: hypothetical protein WC222_03160 [Parachlamydiales bacterium]|jgi:hypothetical protein